MTFCTYSPANFAHNAWAWPGFIVGAGPDVGVMRPSRVLVTTYVSAHWVDSHLMRIRCESNWSTSWGGIQTGSHYYSWFTRGYAYHEIFGLLVVSHYLSLVPRLFCVGREKRAWYTLSAHAPNIQQLFIQTWRAWRKILIITVIT